MRFDTLVSSLGSVGEVASTFVKLGLTSFGGPVAHIGYLRTEIVEKRRWLTDADFADLVALCQFLPGPASSQMVFALGLRRAGWTGAVVASVMFTLPSALVMIAFAYGVLALGPAWTESGWVRGLKVAAVAVVAQAVHAMSRSLWTDVPRVTVGLLAAALALVWTGALGQVVAILGGAVVGLTWKSNGSLMVAARPGGRPLALAALVVFGVLLVWSTFAPPPHGAAGLFATFYRAGALVFGGGHVVLPLLQPGLVDSGLVSASDFLAGYSAAQATPGPLFTIAGYLGTIASGSWLGGVVALAGIFLPGYLLVAAALPSWHWLQSLPRARVAMAGANAAVVGILLAALYDPVFTAAIHSTTECALAMIVFAAIVVWKCPVAWVMGASAAAGVLLLG